jgi:pimeloyl-ACP methyl ester carboxylesterase
MTPMSTTNVPTGRVTSRDGTSIAFTRQGSGPALIVVDGALCCRAFGPSAKLAAQLAGAFTVTTYDRRGRGDSTDAAAYDPAREVDDLDALIQCTGPAPLLGLSSGAALALRAAASGLDVTRVAAYEAPYVHAASGAAAPHASELRVRIAQGDRGGAVTYFLRDMVGVPAAAVVFMRCLPWVWPKLKAVAHTLPYDAEIMEGFVVPVERLATVRVPVLVAHGSRTDPRIAAAARRIGDAVPGARQAVLEGQTHNVKPAALAQAVTGFLRP